MGWLKSNLSNYQLVFGVIIAIFIGSAAAGAAGSLTSYQNSARNTGAISSLNDLEQAYWDTSDQVSDVYNLPPQSGQSVDSSDPAQVVVPSPEPALTSVEVKPIDRCPYSDLQKMPCTYYCPDAVTFSSNSICHPCSPYSNTEMVCVDEHSF